MIHSPAEIPPHPQPPPPLAFFSPQPTGPQRLVDGFLPFCISISHQLDSLKTLPSAAVCGIRKACPSHQAACFPSPPPYGVTAAAAVAARFKKPSYCAASAVIASQAASRKPQAASQKPQDPRALSLLLLLLLCLVLVFLLLPCDSLLLPFAHRFRRAQDGLGFLPVHLLPGSRWAERKCTPAKGRLYSPSVSLTPTCRPSRCSSLSILSG